MDQSVESALSGLLRHRAYRRSGDRPTTILSFCNRGYVELAFNLYLSLARIGLADHLVLVCSDRSSFEYLENRGAAPFLVAADSVGLAYSSVWSGRGFGDKVKFRLDVLQRALRAGVDILHLDCDVVVLKNPFRASNSPVVAQLDDPAESVDPKELCVGCAYLRCESEAADVIEFMMTAWIDSPRDTDQPLFNEGVRRLGIPAETLPRDQYPNGAYWLSNQPRDPVLIHFNHILGKPNKIWRMRDADCWFVPRRTVRIEPRGTAAEIVVVLACASILAWDLVAELEIDCRFADPAFASFELVTGSHCRIDHDAKAAPSNAETLVDTLVPLFVADRPDALIALAAHRPFFLDNDDHGTASGRPEQLRRMLDYMFGPGENITEDEDYDPTFLNATHPAFIVGETGLRLRAVSPSDGERLRRDALQAVDELAAPI